MSEWVVMACFTVYSHSFITKFAIIGLLFIILFFVLHRFVIILQEVPVLLHTNELFERVTILIPQVWYRYPLKNPKSRTQTKSFSTFSKKPKKMKPHSTTKFMQKFSVPNAKKWGKTPWNCPNPSPFYIYPRPPTPIYYSKTRFTGEGNQDFMTLFATPGAFYPTFLHLSENIFAKTKSFSTFSKKPKKMKPHSTTKFMQKFSVPNAKNPLRMPWNCPNPSQNHIYLAPPTHPLLRKTGFPVQVNTISWHFSPLPRHSTPLFCIWAKKFLPKPIHFQIFSKKKYYILRSIMYGPYLFFVRM